MNSHTERILNEYKDLIGRQAKGDQLDSVSLRKIDELRSELFRSGLDVMSITELQGKQFFPKKNSFRLIGSRIRLNLLSNWTRLIKSKGEVDESDAEHFLLLYVMNWLEEKQYKYDRNSNNLDQILNSLNDEVLEELHSEIIILTHEEFYSKVKVKRLIVSGSIILSGAIYKSDSKLNYGGSEFEIAKNEVVGYLDFLPLNDPFPANDYFAVLGIGIYDLLKLINKMKVSGYSFGHIFSTSTTNPEMALIAKRLGFKIYIDLGGNIFLVVKWNELLEHEDDLNRWLDTLTERRKFEPRKTRISMVRCSLSTLYHKFRKK